MRYELSEREWCVIRPMLPNKPYGIRRVDNRRVLNGIFWVLRSGALWRADASLRAGRGGLPCVRHCKAAGKADMLEHRLARG